MDGKAGQPHHIIGAAALQNAWVFDPTSRAAALRRERSPAAPD